MSVSRGAAFMLALAVMPARAAGDEAATSPTGPAVAAPGDEAAIERPFKLTLGRYDYSDHTRGVDTNLRTPRCWATCGSGTTARMTIP